MGKKRGKDVMIGEGFEGIEDDGGKAKNSSTKG